MFNPADLPAPDRSLVRLYRGFKPRKSDALMANARNTIHRYLELNLKLQLDVPAFQRQWAEDFEGIGLNHHYTKARLEEFRVLYLARFRVVMSLQSLACKLPNDLAAMVAEKDDGILGRILLALKLPPPPPQGDDPWSSL